MTLSSDSQRLEVSQRLTGVPVLYFVQETGWRKSEQRENGTELVDFCI